MDIAETFNLSNKLKHPTNRSKVVYRHVDKAQAETFATLLVDADIDFEVQVDEEDERKPTYFGVLRRHESEVDRLNYRAIGAHRRRFIASPALRWVFISVSIGMLLLAVIGAWLSS